MGLGLISTITSAATGAITGFGGNKQRSSSESRVRLGGQSSLDQLLSGRGVAQLSPAEARERARINSEIDRFMAAAEYEKNKGNMAKYNEFSRKVNEYTKMVEDLDANANQLYQGGVIEDLFGQLQSRIGNQVAANDLDALLKQYRETGGAPTQQDIAQAGGLASNLFAARRKALEQSLADQYTQFNQAAGARGAMTNDPVAIAKLRTGFMRQQDMLSAEQQAQGTNLAFQLGQGRLNAASQRAALELQGTQNISTLLGLGSNLQAAERNFRIQTGTQMGNQTSGSGGGFTGAAAGAIGGAGMGMQIASNFQQSTAFQPTQMPQGGGYTPGFFSQGGQGGGGLMYAPQGGANYNLGNYGSRF